MAEDYTLGGSSASTGQQPQQGTPSPTTPAPGDDGTSIENPTAKKYAEEAATERKARKALEAKLAEYTKADEERKQAQLSDAEKAAKRAETAEAAAKGYQQKLAALSIQIEAQKLGIIDPELAALAINGQLEYGDDGMPTNAEKLLSELLKAKPFLAGQQTPTQQQPARPNVGQPMAPARGSQAGALNMDIIARMSPDEYASRYTEIQQYFARVTAEQRMRGQ